MIKYEENIDKISIVYTTNAVIVCCILDNNTMKSINRRFEIRFPLTSPTYTYQMFNYTIHASKAKYPTLRTQKYCRMHLHCNSVLSTCPTFTSHQYPFVAAYYYFDEFVELKGAYTETLQNPRELQRGIIRIKYNLNTAGN
uniref:Uncharacterized protein n=1 Tax=Glossina pallidipes TaxID=7398 RepID=A0A1B0AEG9_GLOPL